jgi:transposase-like protein
MGRTRRKFTLEFKTEAAHRVIDTGRSIAEVSAELSVRTALWRGGCAMSVVGWTRQADRRMNR